MTGKGGHPELERSFKIVSLLKCFEKFLVLLSPFRFFFLLLQSSCCHVVSLGHLAQCDIFFRYLHLMLHFSHCLYIHTQRCISKLSDPCCVSNPWVYLSDALSMAVSHVIYSSSPSLVRYQFDCLCNPHLQPCSHLSNTPHSIKCFKHTEVHSRTLSLF